MLKLRTDLTSDTLVGPYTFQPRRLYKVGNSHDSVDDTHPAVRDALERGLLVRVSEKPTLPQQQEVKHQPPAEDHKPTAGPAPSPVEEAPKERESEQEVTPSGSIPVTSEPEEPNKVYPQDDVQNPNDPALTGEKTEDSNKKSEGSYFKRKKKRRFK